MNRFFLAIILAATTLYASISNAAVIYNETINGDLSAYYLGGTSINLIEGVNEIKGTFSYSIDQFADQDLVVDNDGLVLHVASNLIIDNYTVTITGINIIDPGNANYVNGVFRAEGIGGPGNIHRTLFGSGDEIPAASATPVATPYEVINRNYSLGPGTYSEWSIGTNGWGFEDNEPFYLGKGHMEFDYTASVTTSISPVPVPAAVWLFSSGLLGLIGMARRKA